MRLLKRMALFFLCGLLMVFAQPMGAFAAGAEDIGAEKRGKAVYYGREIDRDTLYDDNELKNIGFDDTDIAYLKGGYDVTYYIEYTRNSIKNYNELGNASTYKRLINDYYGDRIPDPDNSFLTYFYPARVRGDGSPEELHVNVRDVRGTAEFPINNAQGSIADYIKNETVTMLYLDSTFARRTDITVSAGTFGTLDVDFEFIGTGSYIVLCESNIKNNTSIPSSDSETDHSGMPKRGKATYYETVLDDSILYNNEELKKLGFDDTDIEYLEKEFDVTYAILHDKNSPKRYGDLDENSVYRKLIDNYYTENNRKGTVPDDSLMTYYYPARKRGYEEAVQIDADVKNVHGTVEFSISSEKGNVHDYINNGIFTMLYLDGDKARSTGITVSTDIDENVVITFEFIGTGNYIVLYTDRNISKSEPSRIIVDTDQGTRDSSSYSSTPNNSGNTNNTDQGTSNNGTNYISTSSGSGTAVNIQGGQSGRTDDNPDSGIGASLAGVTLAAGAVIVYNGRRHKKKRR